MPDILFPKDLPPFTLNANCPKCGADSISVHYHSYYETRFPCGSTSLHVLGEHLCRICARCRFGWCEAPIDIKPADRPDLGAVNDDPPSE